VQVRVGSAAAGALGAGAPTPSRDLRPDEVEAAIAHFTVGQRGPRATPCDEVVLSALVEPVADQLPALVARARGWGVGRFVLHLTAPIAAAAAVDEVVVVARAPADLARLEGWTGARRVVVLPLEARAMEDGSLDEAAAAAVEARPDAIVLSWPFPPGPTPAPPDAVVAWIDAHERRLARVAWSVKGIPGCLVGRYAARRSRTRNRWYVDADRQGAAALLVVPGLIRFARPDLCRFCSLDAVCDGVPSSWLDRGLAPGVHPLGVAD
jgi:hypothetical protein